MANTALTDVLHLLESHIKFDEILVLKGHFRILRHYLIYYAIFLEIDLFIILSLNEEDESARLGFAVSFNIFD